MSTDADSIRAVENQVHGSRPQKRKSAKGASSLLPRLGTTAVKMKV
jgi:hypothetical protein